MWRSFVTQEKWADGRRLSMLRSVLLLALVGGGLGAWNSLPVASRSALNWAVGEAHAMVCEAGKPAASEPQVVEGRPIVPAADSCIPDDRFLISQETLAAITCGPWDVSEAGIEAILQEMIHRGWTPPSEARALEASRHNGGVIAAVEPDALVPPAGARPRVRD